MSVLRFKDRLGITGWFMLKVQFFLRRESPLQCLLECHVLSPGLEPPRRKMFCCDPIAAHQNEHKSYMALLFYFIYVIVQTSLKVVQTTVNLKVFPETTVVA